MKKTFAVLGIVALGVLGVVGPATASPSHPPVASASKYCSAYAEEHFGDRNAETPDGVKCLGSGEYCSHAPGYSAAYRRAGFVCQADGRLTRR
jgi:hypothetical protein